MMHGNSRKAKHVTHTFSNRGQSYGRLKFRAGLIVALAVSGALSVGCGVEEEASTAGIPVNASDETQSSVTSFVLSEIPTGDVTTPTDIKELAGDPISTVLVGRIDAGDLDPFQPGEVAFMISQMPDEGHVADDPDHADNCPFCKRTLANAPKAIVQFHGSDGKVIPGDARQILSIDKGDVVYVTGTAQYNPAVNTVMVDATGVFRKSN